MSDTIKKYEENYSFFQEEWNKPITKYSNILTPNQALDIVNRLYLYCENKEELTEDFEILKTYLKQKL